MNETLKTIHNRQSVRLYENKNITDEELNTILLAGIEAPSAMNTQLCECFAITDSTKIDELAQYVKEAYQQMGNDRGENYHFAYHAPTLVIVAGPKDYTRRVEDGSCMLENMFLAASSIDVGSCWINQLRDTQDNEKVKNFLNECSIPEDFLVVGCCALGYQAKEMPIKEKKKERIHIIK